MSTLQRLAVGKSRLHAVREVSVLKPSDIAHHASCTADYPEKVLNILANQLRQDIARSEGYTALMCTDVESNEPERRTLAHNGWHDIYGVVNKRTQNRVLLSLKEL